MSVRTLSLAATLFAASSTLALAQTEIRWWHAMAGVNNDIVNRLAAEFNAAQSDYKVVASFKGSYPETLTAGIAAYRAGDAPHILQVFEVGTATMMAAGKAIKPVGEVMKEAGEPFDPKAYLPAIYGYYSTAKGELLSFPFNSSSMVMYYNKDAFKKAGLDPEAPPKTWPELFEAAKKLQTLPEHKSCGFTTAWPTWANIEQFSVWHNTPLATKGNGIDGFDAALTINTPPFVRHLANLAELQRTKAFDYSGRTNSGEGRFSSGECPIELTSSGFYGAAKANAKFQWGNAPMPYYPDIQGAPQNSTLGGASLWVMGGKKPDEYKGVARFFAFLSDTDRQAKLHTESGYLPVTLAAYEKVKASGFYKDNPYLETPIKELTNKPPTENSRGLRLGNLPQIRDIWAEEIEQALSGAKTAQAALDAAKVRGDAALRQFERTVSR